MSNLYAPPKSDVVTRLPKAPRPLEISVLSALFIILSIASTTLAYFEEGESAIVVLACSIILGYLLRGIYLGRERDRKAGVFLGGLIALMNFIGLFDVPGDYAELQRALYVVEGLFGLTASVYLMKLKGSPFFNN